MENIILICTHCETVQKSSPWPRFSVLFLKLVQINLIYSDNLRIFCMQVHFKQNEDAKLDYIYLKCTSMIIEQNNTLKYFWSKIP